MSTARTTTGSTPTDTKAERPGTMNTNTLAAGVVGFLLGGLTVSIAAELESDSPAPPTHETGQHAPAQPEH
jgi:hypothetical protein